MEPQSKRLIIFLIFPSLLAVGLIFIAYSRVVPTYNLNVNFYNVGQGDSTFIQTFQGNQILVDGGPGNTVLNELSHDMPFFDRTIELMIVSHPHEDHVSGLIEVLKRYKVEKILLPDVEFKSDTFEEFLRLSDEKQIEKIYGFEGKRIYLDDATVFDIYYPPPGHFIADNNYSGFKENKRNPNDVSIVGKLSFGKTKILFTGDAGEEIEKLILPKYNLDSDILKVGHQGSKYSSSTELLQEVTPEYSVIMVGKNSYGHPTPEAMERIKTIGSKIFRTDLNQTVRFESNGQEIFVTQ